MKTMYEKLESLARPIRVGVAGAGEFSLEMISQISYMKNMEVSVIGDIKTENSVRAFREAGFTDDDIKIADSPKQAQRYLEQGKRVVLENALDMCQLDIDAVCDITGDPPFGAEFAFSAIQNKKHTIVVNLEADVVTGSILRRYAEKAGVVYTQGDGDQPSLIKGLYDWAKTLGLDITVAGKWTHLYPFSKDNPSLKRSDIGYLDGSKNQVEMCCVANMTGFSPDIKGMHKPSLRLDEIVNTLCLKSEGGILNKNGIVDVVNCISPDGKEHIERALGGGVFIIIKTDNPHAIHAIKNKGFIKSADNTRALIYRPHHFVGVETPISIVKAVLYNEPTGCVLPVPKADVISVAKRDLRAGETLDGIGGLCVRGVIADARESLRERKLPLGLAENVVLNQDVKKGGELTYDMLKEEGSALIWRLRKEQDRSI